MSEESEPKKKVARKKSARKRTTSKKAAKKAAPKTEEELPLIEESTPTVLPGESLSSQPSAETPASDNKESEQAPPTEANEPSSEGDNSSERPQRKTRVRDARRESAGGGSEETSEPFIKETTENEFRIEGREPKEKEEREEKQDRGDRPEKGGRRGRGRRGRGGDGPIQPRVEVDHDQLRKKAWKIFQSEVTEEGLALLDDKGLREYARSSFNAARLFLEEEGRLK